MPLIDCKCPSCGAPLRISDDAKGSLTCPYCGNEYIAEEAITNITNITNNNYSGATIIQSSSKDDFEIEQGVLKVYRGNDSVVVIPEGVKKISCNFNEYITKIVLPSSLVDIDAKVAKEILLRLDTSNNTLFSVHDDILFKNEKVYSALEGAVDKYATKKAREKLEEQKKEQGEQQYSAPVAKDNFEKVPEQSVEEPKEGKKKSKLRKIIDWIVTGLFGALIACSVAFTIYVKSTEGTGKNAYIFDYLFPVVLTDSMCPDYPVNSVLVIKKVDPATIKVGDDVMFYYDFGDGNGQIKVTHRITEARTVEGTTGTSYRFTAHGINKESEFCGYYISETDEWVYRDCTDQMQYFSEAEVIGKVVGKSSLLGLFSKITSTIWGWLVIILIPTLYLVITAVMDIFKKLPDDDEETPQLAGAGGGAINIKSVTRPDGSDPLAGLTPEEKEKLKKQLLEQMLKEKGGSKK